jgi:hypothetical protein
MGVITGILTFPLAPVRGVAWIAGQLVAAAEEQLYDAEAIQAELRQLSEQLEAGLITEDEFDLAEDELLDRLQDAMQWRTAH